MTGQIGPPFDLLTTKFDLTYAADWHPQQLTMEGALRNETLNIGTSFGLTTATNEVVQGQKRGGVTHQVSPRTLVIPVNFFAAYEAVAARLTTLQAGAQFPVYIAPEGEITVSINRSHAAKNLGARGRGRSAGVRPDVRAARHADVGAGPGRSLGKTRQNHLP